MKKVLLLLGFVLILNTGCGVKAPNNVQTDKEIKTITTNLAIAAINGEKDKMVKLSNDLLAKQAIPKEIQLKSPNCAEVHYTFNGKEYQEKYCK